jgi:hypothetical protein
LAIAWKDFHFFYGGPRVVLLRLAAYFTIAWWFPESVEILVTPPGSTLGETLTVWGWSFLNIELAGFAALFLARERWGKTLGAIVALPHGLGAAMRQKFRAAILWFLPSILIITAGFAIGGYEMCRKLGELFADDHYAVGWQSAIRWIPQTAAFFLLVTNLSLRLRWAALPLAYGIGVIVEDAINIYYTLIVIDFGFGGPMAFVGQNRIVDIMKKSAPFVVYAIVTLLLYRQTRTLFLRQAAEE